MSTLRRQKTRLSPPMMFAFRDAHRAKDARAAAGDTLTSGEKVLASRHAAITTITEPQLREELMRDLDMLMNTTNLASVIDLDDAPEVDRSIINFGLPDVIQMSIDEYRVESISESMAAAISAFEPRLAKDSVKVSRDTSADAGSLQIRFNVAAEIICDPVSLPVEFIADLEVASGRLAVRKR